MSVLRNSAEVQVTVRQPIGDRPRPIGKLTLTELDSAGIAMPGIDDYSDGSA